jgi:hypothetical protein
VGSIPPPYAPYAHCTLHCDPESAGLITGILLCPSLSTSPTPYAIRALCRLNSFSLLFPSSHPLSISHHHLTPDAPTLARALHNHLSTRIPPHNRHAATPPTRGNATAECGTRTRRPSWRPVASERLVSGLGTPRNMLATLAVVRGPRSGHARCAGRRTGSQLSQNSMRTACLPPRDRPISGSLTACHRVP